MNIGGERKSCLEWGQSIDIESTCNHFGHVHIIEVHSSHMLSLVLRNIQTMENVQFLRLF